MAIIQKAILFVCFIIFTSCVSDDPKNTNQTLVNTSGQGVIITNEGNFMFGNASITYYSPKDSTVTKDIYQISNKNTLGDVCQSLSFFNHLLYVVVNNSGKVEILNPHSFKSEGEITGLTSPRYFLGVNRSKAYISDLYANKIAVVNLTSKQIVNHIPCKGWTEEMHLANGKAYITNIESEYLFVVNTLNDKLEDSLWVGLGCASIQEDKDGKLWTLCAGSSSNPITKAKLHKIDLIDFGIEKTFEFAENIRPKKLKINGNHEDLYFLANGVYKMNINASTIPTSPIIAQNYSNFYSLGINPFNNQIYVSDALDYTQRGKIYRYNPEGVLIHTFLADIIPGNIYFK
jgi:hypothetical protein